VIRVNSWGREQKSDTPSGYRFLALGAAIVVFGLAVLSSGGGKESVLRREETAAAALIVGTDTSPGETEPSEEPPGYLNGKWNFWEYVGDRLASLITGK
jgi:hypothetical protein